MKALILILVIFVPFFAFAQEPKIPESAIKELADDLATLHQQVLELQKIPRWTAGVRPFPAQTFTVTQESAHIRTGATATAKSLGEVLNGHSFQVLDKVNNWYAVALDKPIGGLHSAWMNAADGVPNWPRHVGDALTPYMNYSDPWNFPRVSPLGSPPTESLKDKIYQALIDSVINLRDKYNKNPYFFVTGFSITVGLPPSVNIIFELKTKK